MTETWPHAHTNTQLAVPVLQAALSLLLMHLILSLMQMLSQWKSHRRAKTNAGFYINC